ncbi:DoxX family membrane protein [bacterium]|nr:DoxX family membrane protein [bacterium]
MDSLNAAAIHRSLQNWTLVSTRTVCMAEIRGWMEAVARVLTASLFLYRAVLMLLWPGAEMEVMDRDGVLFVPAAFVFVLSLYLLSGLALALGYRTRTAAGLLAVYLFLNTFFMHAPWDGESSEIFMFRLAVLGGLLLFTLHTPGPVSFDGRNMIPVRRSRP